MAVTSGFFNSVNHDRLYNAIQMSQIFDGIINDGVYMSVLNHFAVRPQSGMTIVVGGGRAWFKHTWTFNDSDMFVTLSKANAINARIDAIVLKVDTSLMGRKNTIEVIEGEAAATPVKPELVDADGVYYYPLAYITVPAGAIEITASDIENVVGVDPKVPFVTGIIDTVSIDYLIDGWRAEFMEWFENLQYILDGDVAAHLQHEIDEVTEKEFRHYNDLINGTATYTRDEYGEIVRIDLEDTGNNLIKVTEFSRANNVLTVTETITTLTHIYTSITTFDGSESTHTYTKEAL